MKGFEIIQREIEKTIVVKKNIFKCLECEDYETYSAFDMCAHLDAHYIMGKSDLPDGRQILLFKDKDAINKWCDLWFAINYGEGTLLIRDRSSSAHHDFFLCDAIEC
jgi:hypothetical protein